MTRPRPLDAEEIARQLADLPGWSGDTSSITRVLKAPTFMAGISIVEDVAHQAEAMDHHPDIDIRWCTVTFTLSTHDAGGVTQYDIELAHRISESAAQLGAS